MMQTGAEAAAERRVLRRLHRLRLIADPNAGHRLRVAAVKAIQSSLKEGDPLKARRPEHLLAAVRQPWMTERDTFWQPVSVEELFDLPYLGSN